MKRRFHIQAWSKDPQMQGSNEFLNTLKGKEP